MIFFSAYKWHKVPRSSYKNRLFKLFRKFKESLNKHSWIHYWCWQKIALAGFDPLVTPPPPPPPLVWLRHMPSSQAGLNHDGRPCVSRGASCGIPRSCCPWECWMYLNMIAPLWSSSEALHALFTEVKAPFRKNKTVSTVRDWSRARRSRWQVGCLK